MPCYFLPPNRQDLPTRELLPSGVSHSGKQDRMYFASFKAVTATGIAACTGETMASDVQQEAAANMEVNLQTSVITAGAESSGADAPASELANEQDNAGSRSHISFQDVLRQASLSAQEPKTGSGDANLACEERKPSSVVGTAQSVARSSAAAVAGCGKSPLSEVQNSVTTHGQKSTVKTAEGKSKESQGNKLKSVLPFPAAAAAQVPMNTVVSAASGPDIEQNSREAEGTPAGADAMKSVSGMVLPRASTRTSSADKSGLSIVANDSASVRAAWTGAERNTEGTTVTTAPGQKPPELPQVADPATVAMAADGGSYGNTGPSRLNQKTRGEAAEVSKQARDNSSGSGETKTEAQLASGVTAAAMAETTANAVRIHADRDQTETQQSKGNQEASKSMSSPGYIEGAVGTLRTPKGRIAKNTGSTIPSIVPVQETTGVGKTEEQGLGTRDGSSSSRSSDSGRSRGAKNSVPGKAATEPNAPMFAQAMAKDNGNSHGNSPNAANAATSAVGNTGNTGSNTASHTGVFGIKAVVAQRDAGVAPAPGTSSAGAENGLSTVRNAQLVGKANQAGIHIHMDTERLGPLEMRTWAAGNRITTMISTQRPETHWLLSNGVGALHQALNDHNLQVERIDVVWNPGGYTGGHTGGSATGSGAEGNRQGTPLPWSETATAAVAGRATEETTTSSTALPYLEGRLSVRV